jgi:pimeloyl-ACP methyl ester carboxylesterase
VPFLSLARCSLFYEVDGSGPPLLFIHGGSCSHDEWRFQVASLRDEFTVVTVDLRGHGASIAEPADCTIGRYAADIGELLRAIGSGPTVLVGHSLGSRVAVQPVREHPEPMAGIVLIDGSLQATGTAADVERMHASRFGDKERVVELLRPQFEAMFFENADPAQKARALARLDGASGDMVMTRSRATLLWDATELDVALAGLQVPVLAVQSTSCSRHRNWSASRSGALPGRASPRLPRSPGKRMMRRRLARGHPDRAVQPDGLPVEHRVGHDGLHQLRVLGRGAKPPRMGHLSG